MYFLTCAAACAHLLKFPLLLLFLKSFRCFTPFFNKASTNVDVGECLRKNGSISLKAATRLATMYAVRNYWNSSRAVVVVIDRCLTSYSYAMEVAHCISLILLQASGA